MSFKEWKLSDLLSNGFHLLYEESVKRANKSNDGDGYNKVFGLKDGKQIF